MNENNCGFSVLFWHGDVKSVPFEVYSAALHTVASHQTPAFLK